MTNKTNRQSPSTKCTTEQFQRADFPEFLGADLRAVEIVSYNESVGSRRLLAVYTEFKFRISVPYYFAAEALAGLTGLSAWATGQGLPAVTVQQTLATCGTGAEPDPTAGSTLCRACEFGFYKVFFFIF